MHENRRTGRQEVGVDGFRDTAPSAAQKVQVPINSVPLEFR
jgi:hypothetical protein